MEFKKYKLKELATIDISSVDKKTKEGETPVRLCNFTDVYKNWAITKNHYPSLMKASAKQRDIEKFSIHRGQVAITKDSETRDDIGIPTYIADDFENVVLGYHCALITPNKNLDGKYLNAYLNTKMAKKYFEGYASGSGQRYTLTLDSINDIQIWAPNIDEQHCLVKILSDIDQKIALNTRMNAELEAIAKQLYDYWFVQFDFPDENGKPYKSSGGKMVYNETLKRDIPEGWEVKNIESLGSIVGGGTPSKEIDSYWDGLIPFFGPTDYDNNVFQIDTKAHITQEGLNNCSSSLFQNGTIIITARGSVGKLIIVGTPMAMNQSCYAIVPKSDNIEYLYFYTKQIIDQLKQKGGGSVFKSIITSDLQDSYMSIGNELLINEYTKRCRPLFNQIKNNHIEILHLTHLRDSLLPMLMNGQIIVE